MHTVARYNNSEMKLNTNVTENYNGGDKYESNVEEYNNINHRTSDSISVKEQGEHKSGEHKSGENLHSKLTTTNCKDDASDTFEPLANGKVANNISALRSSYKLQPSNAKPVDLSVDDNRTEPSERVNGVDSSVIDLVDKDAVLINDFSGGKAETKAARIERQLNKIEQLKDSLICEEATLSIVRKLIESQRRKDGYSQSNAKHPPASLSLHGKQSAQSASKTAPMKQQQIPPGKSVKPGGAPQTQQKYYVQVGNQLVPASAPSTHTSGTVYQYVNGGTPSSSHNSYQPPQPPPKPQPPKQTPEQKQNAAKAALRRQLEQTLLQIPPPRPPPADWKAIPNVNSIDFMMLVGLDEVVDNILDMDSKPTLKKALEELVPYNPRVCSQCGVDFSPCWKNKDTKDKSVVLCERCALQNVKKDLKAEHTARLKSAFLKALKQEQEIEEKIKAGEDVNISSISPTAEKTDSTQSPSNQPSVRISSPKSVAGAPASRNHNDGPQKVSPGHHQRPVIQHYPHHSPLVQQLHQQHLQQQLDEPPSSQQRHSSSAPSNTRWHPYRPPSSSSQHHQREQHHQSSHHRTSAPSDGAPQRQEYYVVHHPQRGGGRGRYVKR